MTTVLRSVEFSNASDNRKLLARNAVAGAAVGGGLVALTLASPAHAQDATPSSVATDVTGMVTALAGITAAALAVALVPRAASYAFKIIGRVMK